MPGDAQRTLRRAERGANRRAIVAAAEAALREQPFRELSVEDLMQRAGLARTQFYRHFDDLPDLVLQVTGAAFEELLRSHEHLVGIADITAANLRDAIAPAVAAFAAHGPLVRAVTEAAVHDSAVAAVYGDVQERYIGVIAALLRRANAEGAAVRHPDQTARVLHLGNVAYLTDAFGGEAQTTPEKALDTVVGVWCAVLGLAEDAVG